MTVRRLFLWQLLTATLAAQTPSLVVQASHSRAVSSVAFSPDGKLFATAGHDLMVKIWDTESGGLLQTWKATGPGEALVAFSANGMALAVATNWGVLIHQIRDGGQISKYHRETTGVRAIAFSPDGASVAFGGRFGAVVIEPSSGRELAFTPDLDVTALVFHPSGGALVAGTASGALEAVDASALRRVRSMPAAGGNCVALAFDSEGRRLAGAFQDGTTAVWSWGEEHPIVKNRVRSWRLFGLGWVRGGEKLAVGEPRGLHFLDPRTLADGPAHPPQVALPQTMAASSDGKRLLVAGADHALFGSKFTLWDADREIAVYPPDFDPAASPLIFSADGRMLAVAAQKRVHLWSLQTGQPICAVEAGGPAEVGEFLTASFSPSGSWLATRTQQGHIEVFDTARCERVRQVGQANEVGRGEFLAAVIDDQGTVASPCDDGASVCVWRAGVDAPSKLKPDGLARALRFRPNSRELVAGTSKGALQFWDMAAGGEPRRLQLGSQEIITLEFTADGQTFAAGEYGQMVYLGDAGSLAAPRTLAQGEPCFQLSFSSDGALLAIPGPAYLLFVHDVRSLRGRTANHYFYDTASVAFRPGGRFLASRTTDGTIYLWNMADPNQPRLTGTMFTFADGSWAVMDPSRRFDASNSGNIPNLHWSVENELIGLAQLKARYYDPRLLAKLLGDSADPLREVDALGPLELFPRMEIEAPGADNPMLRIRLTDRGGGIGVIHVTLNGKELDLGEDARPRAPGASSGMIAVDLSRQPFLNSDGPNQIGIRVFNRQEYLASRTFKLAYRPKAQPAPVKRPDPSLWALVVGASAYRGDLKPLKYAARDAESMSKAIRVAGSRYFAGRVRVQLLSTESQNPAQQPTRTNILRALTAIERDAGPQDYLFVYFAGHGATYGSRDSEYYYLTSNVTTAALQDPAVRNSALASAELAERMRRIRALKQVLILDTCAAGRVVERASERIGASSRELALDRMADRTGVYILAGSAADAVSYEASRYAQGILTYSLLFGMRGEALVSDGLLDVDRWFSVATESVPRLAAGIGGIQRPTRKIPSSGTIYVGKLLPSDLSEIPLARTRPVIATVQLVQAELYFDILGLSRRVNERFRVTFASSDDPPYIFVEAAEFSGANVVGGGYRVSGASVSLTANLFIDGKARVTFTLQETVGEPPNEAALDRLAARIASEVERRLR